MGPDFLDRQCLWYMFCCNLICVLFLIQNSFSSRISGKRNRISGWPDIRGNPILIHIYCGRIDWFSWYLIRRISFVAGGRSPAQRQGGGENTAKIFGVYNPQKKTFLSPLCILPFVQLFIHAFIFPFNHSFIESFIDSFIHLSIYPLLHSSFHPFAHSFILSIISSSI